MIDREFDSTDLESLERKVHNLSKLVDINSIINSTLDIGKLLTIIMEIIKDIMQTETSTMLLYDDASDDLVFRVALGEAGGKLAEKYRVQMGQGIAGWVAQKRKPVIVNDVYKDDRFDPEFDKSTGFVTRSILCAPLLFKGKLLGVIQAINPLNKAGFDSADRGLFLVFSDQAALAVQNAIFFQNALEEERIKSEISSAKSIQESLIPDISRKFGGVSITARSLPAREVGGEFHEIFQLEDRYTGIALGDLHEKGVPGGLRAAIVNGALMAMSSVRGTRPADMVRVLNRAVSKHMKSEKKISIFYGVIDHDQMIFQFVNAGIAYPILVRDGISRYLRFGEKNLQSAGDELKKISLRLRPGDLLVIVTDGILNIRNRAGKLFGLKRVMGLLQNGDRSTDDIVESLLLSAGEYSEGLERREDISIIAIKIGQAG
ncbi:MAG TPA: SpoIIE family protein phosphatase [Spirochaetota bacterium]|nr:SpoIIE family protein phosphatase [Spirochaetota bacterium]HPI90698.1 SpoIIE family protein phosphatase [Spirochaetota bacterium]HPR49293.1 SpoIIE family protein phosphatase [Spirochaetota bacterium]